MPNGDLKPENQAQGLRVYRTVDDLEARVGQDVNGYRIARDLRDHLANVFTADALRTFAERKIDALGFEIAVDAQAGAGVAPLIPNVQGAIGLQVVWFTDVPPDTNPDLHVYAFANQQKPVSGAGGVGPIGETYSLPERFKVSLFAAYFYGDVEVTPETWSDAISNYEGTGLLSGGSQITNKRGKKLLLGRSNNWLVSTVEIALDATQYGGDSVLNIDFCITFSSFRHGPWLRNVFRGMSPAPQWGKDVDVESLVTSRIGRDGLPDKSFQLFVEADGANFAVDTTPDSKEDNYEKRYLFGGNYSAIHELSSERIDDWLTEWTDVFEWEADDGARPGMHVLRAPAFGSVPQKCLTMQPEKGTDPGQAVKGRYYEAALRRLDDLVYQCKHHGVRLILPLTNYWEWGGGIPKYLERAGLEPSGDDNKYARNQKEKFYQRTKFKEAFKRHIHTILTRENHLTGVQYREEPTIAMWELGNELRPGVTVSGNPDPQFLLDWIEEMSNYINDKDGNHLISTGMGGAKPGLDTGPEKYVPEFYVKAHTKENIDAWSVHVWVDGEDIDHHYPLGKDEGSKIILNHAKVAEDNGMPCYVGEYGWGNPDVNEPDNRVEAFETWKSVIIGVDLPDTGNDLPEKQRVDAALVWDFPGSDENPGEWDYGVFPDHTDTLEHLRPIAEAFEKRNVD